MIELYTSPTPNGYKASVTLEELELPYNVHVVNLQEGAQKTPEFLAMNPNGRIPVIVDPDFDNLAIFETGAIMVHLAEKTGRLMPSDAKGRARVMSWLMFQMGGVGPMMGQAMYFQRIAAKNGNEDPFAIKRYVDESRRLMEVLNTHLEGKDFLVNNEYTIADMATYTWARAYYWANVSVDGLPHLQAWFDRIDERPATQRALEIPQPFWAFFGKGDVEAQERENAERFKHDVKK